MPRVPVFDDPAIAPADPVAAHARLMAAEDALARAKEADARFERETDALFFHPRDGFFARRGRAAVEIFGDLDRRLAEGERRAVEALPDPAERALFQDLAAPRLARLRDGMARHMATERRAWLDQVSDERLQGLARSAANSWTDPEAIDEALASGLLELSDQRDRNRWDGARFQEGLDAFMGETHGAVVGRMLAAGDVARARAHYDRYRDLLPEAARADLESMIGGAEDDGIAESENRGLPTRNADPTPVLRLDRRTGYPTVMKPAPGEPGTDAPIVRVPNRALGGWILLPADNGTPVMAPDGKAYDLSPGRLAEILRLMERFSSRDPSEMTKAEIDELHDFTLNVSILLGTVTTERTMEGSPKRNVKAPEAAVERPHEKKEGSIDPKVEEDEPPEVPERPLPPPPPVPLGFPRRQPRRQ